jgi:hypothetical protein
MPHRAKKPPSYVRTLAQHIALQRHELFMSIIKISFTVTLLAGVAMLACAMWSVFTHPELVPGDAPMEILNTFIEILKIAVSLA